VRGTGANQTIDQVGLYGSYVRGALDLPVPEASGQEAWWRQAAREALEATRSDPVGPVHVNCPFEEPLTPSPDVALPRPSGETLDLPSLPVAELTDEEADRLESMASSPRGVVVIGGWPGDLSDEAVFWAQAVGWPVLAEPTSNVRLPGSSLAAGQLLAGDAAWIEQHTPEVVIQLGAAPTSRATQTFVASAERLVVADRWHLDADPERASSWRLAVDAVALSRALRGHRSGRDAANGTGSDDLGPPRPRSAEPVDDAWNAAWIDADLRARSRLDGFLDGIEEPFEPRIARDVAGWIPDGGTLFVGNSSPVRDLDLAMAPRNGLRVLANRGASGIDGLVSTALGAAAAGPSPTVALIGDLSFLHDLGALAWNARRGVACLLVVLRNGGGEIFTSLPQRALPEHRDLFVTPHSADLGALSRACGAEHTLVEEADALIGTLSSPVASGGVHVVEVAVDPDRTLELRADMREEIAAALR